MVLNREFEWELWLIYIHMFCSILFFTSYLMNSIKAICFDLDGVYFTAEWKSKALDALSELAGKDKVHDFFHRNSITRLFHLWQVSEHEYWSEARKELWIALNDQEFIDLWIKEYHINPLVQRAVTSARNLGYKTCVCTNNNISRLSGLEKKFWFLFDFDCNNCSN
jgi:FMN phosphatase YigB (HAD superfamily)